MTTSASVIIPATAEAMDSGSMMLYGTSSWIFDSYNVSGCQSVDRVVKPESYGEIL